MDRNKLGIRFYILVFTMLAVLFSSTWLAHYSQRGLRRNLMRTLLPSKLFVTSSISEFETRETDKFIEIPGTLKKTLGDYLVEGEILRRKQQETTVYIYCIDREGTNNNAILGVLFDKDGSLFGIDITQHNVQKAKSAQMRNVVRNSDLKLNTNIGKEIKLLLNRPATQN